MKTTRSIAEYVGRSYDDASDFRTGMVNLELPTVDAPEDPPDDAGAVRLELWKLARRRYELAQENRRKVNGRAYALVLGQCSQAVRNRLKAHADWNTTINGGSDMIELLRLIQTCMIQRQTRKHPIHNIVDNEKTILNFKQGRGMSDNDYYQRRWTLLSELAEPWGSKRTASLRNWSMLRLTPTFLPRKDGPGQLRSLATGIWRFYSYLIATSVGMAPWSPISPMSSCVGMTPTPLL